MTLDFVCTDQNLNYNSDGFISLFVASRLNEYISNYEMLDYNPGEVHEKHLRAKRWAISSSGTDAATEPEVHIKFSAHQRDFNLRLKRDTSAFSQNLQLEGDGAGQETDFSHIYSGHVDGTYICICQIYKMPFLLQHNNNYFVQVWHRVIFLAHYEMVYLMGK